MGQEAGVLGARRSQKWTAAAKLQPTFPKSDRLLGSKVLVIGFEQGLNACSLYDPDHFLLEAFCFLATQAP